jgi:DNA mismatch endonuclease (patch repair protein)
MDIWSKKKRSYVMSRILSRDTQPELTVRRILRQLGYRYRLHGKRLPGKPDIVFPGLQKVIFVHGCFWHLHKGCRDGTIPKTRVKYWTDKLQNNAIRDKKNTRNLRKAGWKVLRLWECQTIKTKLLSIKMQRFLKGK